MSFDERLCETFTSPTNIAVIKYWGKNDPVLNTPLNSSASLTLDQDDLHTITTIAASKNFADDSLWINGVETKINGRGIAVLREIRAIASDKYDEKTGELVVKKEDWSQYHVRISTVNTFPTGAGLASSAAGLACLVATLAKLFAVKEQYEGQLTAIARQGSGSASRSMFGGFVRWQKGERADATDSIAVQIADEKHWPEMRAIILVVSDKEKDTSSTYGMETSKKTSPLLAHRAAQVVQPRLDAIEKAFLDRDFETFGRITMQDSNQFHAICLDTYPPIFYMNDTSKMIIRLCTIINDYYGCVKAAYTFDAGPNAVIYCLDKDVPMIFAVMTKYFPAPGALRDYCNNVAEYANAVSHQAFLPEKLQTALEKAGRTPASGDVKYMFHTKSGPGPISQPQSEALLSPETGLPVPASAKHKQMKVVSAPTPSPTPVSRDTCSGSEVVSSGCGNKCPFSLCNVALVTLSIGVGVAIGMKLRK